MKQTFTLDELFSRDEEERLAKVQKEIAAEKAAWDALPQSEKDRIQSERDAFWEDFEKRCQETEEDETDEDEDE